MYSEWVWLLTLAVFVWLGVLTFLLWQQNNFLRSLFPKSGERDIRRKFEEILRQTLDFKEDLKGLKDYLAKVEDLGLHHIQRVELIRFNPYDDTGGDQSFALALLDEQGSGIVLTSLHARSGTRVFAKSVINGKADKHQLSSEEEVVIRKALKKT